MTPSANSSPEKPESFKGTEKTINPINQLQEYVVSNSLGHPDFIEEQGNDRGILVLNFISNKFLSFLLFFFCINFYFKYFDLRVGATVPILLYLYNFYHLRQFINT